MASLLTFVFFASSYLLSLARSADECQPHQWKRDVGDIMCRYHASSGDDVNYYTCMDLAITYDIPIDKFFELNPSVNANCDNIQASTQYCVKGCKCLPAYRCTRALPGDAVTVFFQSLQDCCHLTYTTSNGIDIQPLVSTDGFCGPLHKDASCGDTAAPCCNGLTWTCGSTP